MENRKTYRIVWKHELFLQADSDEKAKELFEKINKSHLARSVIRHTGFAGHNYLEEVSFECMSDDFREVK